MGVEKKLKLAGLPMTWQEFSMVAHHEAGLAIEKINSLEPEILPKRENIFRAFDLCPPESVRVVILGQDPYPTIGNATGLAFSVHQHSKLPASLRNIFKEMINDIGKVPEHGDLTSWAQQGVLLANTALTTIPGQPAAHENIWRQFTQVWIERLGQDKEPRVWILWGKHAQSYKHLIASHHKILESAHPSPLSARHGFFGSKPFSQSNDFLKRYGHLPIKW